MTTNYIDRFAQYIVDYGFQIVVFVAIAFIVIVFVYNFWNGNKGTYYNNYANFLDNIRRYPSIFDVDSSKRGSCNDLDSTDFQKVSKGEAECKRVVEKLFGKPFVKVRPAFLKNSITGSNLELDCYNDELKLAVEYNGEQHYKYVPKFHSSKEAFYNGKYRDDIKARLCRENGVKLIVVPYTVRHQDIESYISQRV